MRSSVPPLRWRWHELGIDPWVEYVRSKANLADHPSRGYLEGLLAMGAAPVSFVVPEELTGVPCNHQGDYHELTTPLVSKPS